MEFTTNAGRWRERTVGANAKSLASAARDLSEKAFRAGHLVSDALDDGKRVVEHSVRRGRIAAEDTIAQSTLLVRKRPLQSVAASFAIGFVVGSAAFYAMTRARKCV